VHPSRSANASPPMVLFPWHFSDLDSTSDMCADIGSECVPLIVNKNDKRSQCQIDYENRRSCIAKVKVAVTSALDDMSQ